MTRIAHSLLAVLALAPLLAPAAGDSAPKAPPAYVPPPETSRFLEGPGVDLTRRYCLTCHSADYVTTQPPRMPPAFWRNEVTKMRNVFGAQIPDDDAKAIADYLVATYTEPSAGRK
jgi:sulfite dehydrogenase